MRHSLTPNHRRALALVLGAALLLAIAPTDTSAASARAVAACSKATALEVAKDQFMWGSDVPSPVNQVLCGPFAGAGSQVMVVTMTAPTCWPVQNWAVYQLVNGTWQRLLAKPIYIAPPLVAVGGEIRVTEPVYRKADKRCLPSGGTHARLVHFAGHSLLAGPWKQVDKPTPAPMPVRQFRSPSTNIGCWINPDEGNAGCTMKKPQASAHVDVSGHVRIDRTKYKYCGCDEFYDAPRLAYGKQISYGPFRCISRETGMSCLVISTGKGFTIAREAITRIG